MPTFEWRAGKYETSPEMVAAWERARAVGVSDEALRNFVAFGIQHGKIATTSPPEPPPRGLMDFSELSFDVRIQMMVGRAWDWLAGTIELSKQISVRANASHSTRSQLAMIGELQMQINYAPPRHHSPALGLIHERSPRPVAAAVLPPQPAELGPPSSLAYNIRNV